MNLTAPPGITTHAYQRAKERLGFGGRSFYDWVNCTWSDWIPINAEFLLIRNVEVSNQSNLFATPWTPHRGVALVLSDDKWIKTVIPFDQQSRMVEESQLNHNICGVISRLVDDGLLDLARIGHKLIGCRFEGPLAIEALEAFRLRRIDYNDLRSFFSTPFKQRQIVLNSLLAICNKTGR